MLAEPCETPRHRRISEWRWRLLRVHYTGGLARLVRSGRGESEHVRLDWKAEEPPSNSEIEVDYAVFLPFLRRGKHINPLELESLISLLRLLHVKEHGHKRLLARVHSRVVLGAVSKERSNSRKMCFLFRKLVFWCLACDIALELVWVRTYLGKSSQCPPSLGQADGKLVCLFATASFLHRPQCWQQLPLSRSWICSVNRCQLLPIRRENMCVNSNPPGLGGSQETNDFSQK